jgi:hypothetical protein
MRNKLLRPRPGWPGPVACALAITECVTFQSTPWPTRQLQRSNELHQSAARPFSATHHSQCHGGACEHQQQPIPTACALRVGPDAASRI